LSSHQLMALSISNFSFFVAFLPFIFQHIEPNSLSYVNASETELADATTSRTSFSNIVHVDKIASSSITDLLQEDEEKEINTMKSQMLNEAISTKNTDLDVYEDVVSTVAALVPGPHGDGSLDADYLSDRYSVETNEEKKSENTVTRVYEAARENNNKRKIEQEKAKEDLYFEALAEGVYFEQNDSRDRRKEESERRHGGDHVQVLSKANIKDMDRPTADLSRPIKLPTYFEEDFEYSDLLTISTVAKENEKKN